MTGLEIGAIIAAVAGAAMQQYANYSANKAAQAKLNDAMYQLNDDGKKINDVIAEATKDMDAGKRYEQQQEIAKNVSDDLKSNVAESQALRNESQAVQGNVSNDYAAARQAANEKTMATSNAFADLVGKIRSAAQLRQNEGINLTRAGQKVDQIAREARGNWQVGQVRVNDALHSKDGLKAAGQIVSALGAAMGMGAGFAGNATQTAIPEALSAEGATYGSSAATGTIGTNPFSNDYARFFAQGNGGYGAIL